MNILLEKARRMLEENIIPFWQGLRDDEYGGYIVGRMGLPYREKKVNIISVVVDASHDVISALSGKIGSLKGVTARTVYSGAGE